MRRKRPQNKGLSKPAKKQVKQIVKRIDAQQMELKYIEGSGGLNVSDAGSINTMNYPLLGTGDGQRIGDTIQLKSVSIRFSWACTSDVYNVCRLVVIQWNERSDIAQPTMNSIFDAPGANGVYSDFNPNTRQQFKVLYDKIFTGTPATTSNIHYRKITLTKMLKKIVLIDPNTAVNNIIKGEIYGLVVSDSSVATHPFFFWKFRLNYTDA